jgi:hypothetical protein
MAGRLNAPRVKYVLTRTMYAGFLIVYACGTSGGATTSTSSPAQGGQGNDRPECPHNPRGLSLNYPAATDEVEEILDIPEFHDCQRLIIQKKSNGPLEYTNLTAIYAVPRLDQRFPRMGIVRDRARLAAIIYSYQKPYDVLPEQGYPLLGIKTGFNCLYLQPDGKNWTAFVTQLDKHTNKCNEVWSGKERHMLQVHPLAPPDGYTPQDIPPVARWDWDASHSWQYIGIRCGNWWCEAGPEGFRPSENHLPIPAEVTSHEGKRPYLVKGWFDQQLLAVEDHASPVRLRPGAMMGTVVPIHTPEEKSFIDYQGGLSRAHIFVTGGDYPKLGLKQHPPTEGPGQPNWITVKAPPGGSEYNPAAMEETWEGAWHPSSGTMKPTKVIRRSPHAYSLGVMPGSLDIPATARWRWTVRDETVWTECIQHCCEQCVPGSPNCN